MNHLEFKTLYKTWETTKLLDIVDNPTEYQPLAVQAAQFEIDMRQLTQEKMDEAKNLQNLRRQNEAREQRTAKDIEDQIQKTGTFLLNTLNPIQKKLFKNKFASVIFLFIVGLFFFRLYKEFDMIVHLFTSENIKWKFNLIWYFLPFIILPIAGILFWFGKRIGWMLTTIYFSYTIAVTIVILIMGNTRTQNFDLIFPVFSTPAYIGTLLVFSGFIWALCKKNTREIYEIDKRSMSNALTMGMGIV